jgi:hypothetical protein
VKLSSSYDRLVACAFVAFITSACGDDYQSPRTRDIAGWSKQYAAERQICVDRGGVPIVARTGHYGMDRLAGCEFPPAPVRLER